MFRRLVAASTLAVVLPLLAGATAAHADGPRALRLAGASSPSTELVTTSTTPSGPTTERLPGTTLEAESRDDGTSPAPWLIGSAITAAAAIAIGGSLLKRRMG